MRNILMPDSRGGIPRVFVGSTNGHRSFLGELFRKIPYLNKGAHAVGKEALRARINVIEDVENNKPLKKTVKRFAESRDNLKKKAKEKLSSLIRRYGYKISVKSSPLQFPPDRDRRSDKRKLPRRITGKKSKKK